MVSISNAPKRNGATPELFNVVFSMPERELFTAEDVAEKLRAKNLEVSPGQIEIRLRQWSDAGKLSRLSKHYTVTAAPAIDARRLAAVERIAL